MAAGKEQVEWNRASMEMANARLAFHNPDRVRVYDLIPKRYQPKEPQLSEAAKKRIAERSWFQLATAMFKGR